MGHGAKSRPGSTGPAQALARQLRARGLFGEVHTAFYRVPPFIADTWSSLRSREVFIVPLTISEGYFTTEVIPSLLGLGSLAGRPLPSIHEARRRVVRFCQPLGTHERMTDSLILRARSALQDGPTDPPPRPETTALFIAGHGTSRNRQSRQAVEQQVDRIAARGCFAEVHAAFMLESPRIEDCWHATRQPDLVLVPFFTSDGLHTLEDIPVMLGASREAVHARLERGEPTWVNPTRRGHQRLWYSPALNADPALAELVLERVREALALPPPSPHA